MRNMGWGDGELVQNDRDGGQSHGKEEKRKG